jgi:TatD DNase family protein
VIIHDRIAHEEVVGTLRDWAKEMRASPLAGRLGVLHTFSGDISMAEEVVSLGFYVGISGPVTYPDEPGLPEVVRAVPMERLLLETDCPYLPPQPYRHPSQRNEPAYVRLVAERIAELKDVPLSRVAEATTANARRLFGLDGH